MVLYPKSTIKENIEHINGTWDETKEWKYDPKGYFLIKIDKEKRLIEVGYCKGNNVVEKVITGKNPQEIYYTILRLGLISTIQHGCYLGKELTKAAFAIKNNLEYIQDDEGMITIE
jgi:dihydropteroate synthase